MRKPVFAPTPLADICRSEGPHAGAERLGSMTGRRRKLEARSKTSPPMDARERLLGSAARLFCRYGINAVGIDAVVAEAETAKATLYKAFGSKDGLVEAVLEREGAAWRDWFIGALLKGEASPRQRLERIFPLLAEWFSGDSFFGCPFINAVGEHDKLDSRFRDIALSHKHAVLAAIAGLARQAGASDPEAMAHKLGLLIDGAIVAALITGQEQPARLAGAIALDVLSPLPG